MAFTGGKKKMSFGKKLNFVIFMAALAASSARAQDGDASKDSSKPFSRGHAGIFSVSADAGYYTYGMKEVNDRLNTGGGSISGGAGYGGAVKLGINDNLAVKVGIDYLFASTLSTRTYGGTTYNTEVSLPATMIFIGGEYVFLPLAVMDVKLIAGYTLITIFNGHEQGTAGTDMGSIAGQGSGAQVGLGLEFPLGRNFSLETDLGYNLARIYGATFAGAPSDPNSTNGSGTVDYSGLVAKVGVTFYLVQ
jgi:hypothetical protein